MDIVCGNRRSLDRLAAAQLLVIDEVTTAHLYEAEFMSAMRVIHRRLDNRMPTILINDQERTRGSGDHRRGNSQRVSERCIMR